MAACVAASAVLVTACAKQRQEPAAGPPAGAAPTQTDLPPGDAPLQLSFEQVVAIQERHVATLMALPGVVAVGVGALDDGRYSINVSLAREDARVRARIPVQLEGVPVVVDVSGEIRPLRP